MIDTNVAPTMSYETEQILFSPEESAELHGLLSAMAGERKQSGEEDLLILAQHDPKLAYHDFNNGIFKADNSFPSTALRGIEATLLGRRPEAPDRSVGGKEPIETSLSHVDRIVRSLEEPLKDIPSILDAGGNVAVVTAHKTRWEPTMVALMVQAALAKRAGEVTYNRFREHSRVILSRYLSCFDVNLGALGAKANKINMIELARSVGDVALTFPDTPNMQRSGIDVALRNKYNRSVAKKLIKPGRGTLTFYAGNGTMEELQDGIYPITQAADGSTILPKLAGSHVIAVASDHDAPVPYSIASKIIAKSEVTKDTVHGAMLWIAKTLTKHKTPATYDLPEGIRGLRASDMLHRFE